MWIMGEKFDRGLESVVFNTMEEFAGKSR